MYLITTDDLIIKSYVDFLTKKSEVLDKIKEYKGMTEKLSGV